MYSLRSLAAFLLRWAVLFTGVVAWFRAIGGKTAKRPWTPKDELWGLLFDDLASTSRCSSVSCSTCS